MADGVSLEVSGIAGGLDLLILHLTDFARGVEILDEATALLLNRIRTRFLAEQDTQGIPWVPSRAGLKRRAHGGTGTLFDTGRLFHSIQAAATGPDERKIFTDVEYAAQHQFGLNGMVKREFIGAGPDDITLIEQLLIKRVKEAING